MTRRRAGLIWAATFAMNASLTLVEEIELQSMLKKAGFSKIESSIVSRESESPFFQTLLASGIK
jgi:hypothetical protein